MDKNKIKSHLQSFIAEADKKPIGLSSTEKVQRQEKDVNKDYYKEVTKKMGEYDKSSTDDADSIAKGKLEKTDSEEMDVNPNGMDQIQYDNEPGKKFKQRAIDALEGSSMMGNKTHEGKWDPSTGAGNGNTEEVWGASGGKHTGKEIVKAAKAVSKKDANPQEDAVGYVPSKSKTKLATENRINKKTLSENIKWDVKNVSGHANELTHMTHFGIHKPTNSIVGFWDYPDEDPEDLKLDKDHYFFGDIKDDYEGNMDKYKKSDFVIVTKKGLLKRGIDLNNYPRLEGQDYGNNEVTNRIGENKIKNTKKENIKEVFGTLMLAGGVLVAGAIVKGAIGKVKNKIVQKNFEVTGEEEIVSNEQGKAILRGFTDKRNGNHYWGLTTTRQTNAGELDIMPELLDTTLFFKDEDLDKVKSSLEKNIKQMDYDNAGEPSAVSKFASAKSQKNSTRGQTYGENKINNNEIIKESKMKRLKFNESFNGLGGALQKIPAKYKVDNKVFEMTDGNENYRIKWEGTLTEGEAVVLIASDKKMMNEDIQQMKHLMGFKSETTLGTPSAKDRLAESTTFRDIMNMTNTILTEGVNEDGDRKALNETAFAGGAGMGFSNESNMEGGEPLKDLEESEEVTESKGENPDVAADGDNTKIGKTADGIVRGAGHDKHVMETEEVTEGEEITEEEEIDESEDVMEGFESPAVFTIAEADKGGVMNAGTDLGTDIGKTASGDPRGAGHDKEIMKEEEKEEIDGIEVELGGVDVEISKDKEEK